MNKFMRQIFAAESEVSGLHQKGMFFNEAEAEALGAAAQPAQEEVGGEDDKAIAVPGHKRARRGRKPLDPALPREVVRHELAQAERVCPHDGTALQEIGVVQLAEILGECVVLLPSVPLFVLRAASEPCANECPE